MADNVKSVFDMEAGTSLDLIAGDPKEENTVMLEETVAASIIGEQERAEIDMMIATAKRYPRNLKRFITKARTLACATPEIAAGCSYALPRGNKTLIGPSIRLAEIIAPSWENCRYGGRITDIGERFVSVQGFFYDLENNVGVVVDVRRRITDKHGNRYNDDMIQQTCQAAVSIAVRNAIFRGIPGGYVEAVRREAEDIALGKREGLEDQTKKAFKWFKDEHEISKKEILRTLGVDDVKNITWGHMSRLMGFRTSIQTGESTAEQIFAENPEAGLAAPPKAGRQTRKRRTPSQSPETGKEKGDGPEDGESPATDSSGTGVDDTTDPSQEPSMKEKDELGL